MAKKRSFKRAFRTARAVGRKMYKRSRGYSKSNFDLLDVKPIAYGYVRPMIVDKLPQLSPLGNFSDNVLLGGAAFLIGKTIKNKMAKDIAVTVINAEKFLIGNDLNNMTMGSGTTKSEFVYG